MKSVLKLPIYHDRFSLFVYLDEGLDTAALGELLLAHGLCHLARVALDASDQSMAIGAVLGAVILLLDDDSLLACVLAREDNAHLAGFHEFDHDEEFKPSSV